MSTNDEASVKATNGKRIAIIVMVTFAVTYVGIDLWTSYNAERQQILEQGRSDQAVRQLVSSEELLLELTPLLRPLSRSVLNMELPDTSARSLFADRIELSGELALSKQQADSPTGAVTRPWVIENRTEVVGIDDLQIWESLFAETAYFRNAKFYFVRGNFPEGTFERFNAVVGFDGLAIYRDGRNASLHAELDVIWTRQTDSGNGAAWRITSWKLVDLKSLEASRPLFTNVLENVVADKDLLLRATTSQHTKITSDLIKGKDFYLPKGETYPFFFPDATLEHPGVAVVDIDDNGFDDLYVAMRYGPNLLFQNNGDGTFEEVAAEYGLDIADDSTSAIFADFDNDGDPDLFLGRARRPSLYLVNRKGQFVDETSQLIDCDLPALVSSISAADYNGDGLLDVYLCTYSPIESYEFVKRKKPMWVDRFLSAAQNAKYGEMAQGSHTFLSQTGPPNLLLRNSGGGKFEIAKESPQLELWRMTFQASWHDFDSDGDPDIYVTNDFAPDHFFRNDGNAGFTDITRESGLTGMGFGMGVSWGDYDNDQQVDAYVSNMYSKAGQRITSQVEGIDPRFRQIAKGNFLYRRDGNKFSQEAGFQESEMKVSKAGWSWGGQFLDFNNDGFRDIYVASGYYTAPADVAVDIDL